MNKMRVSYAQQLADVQKMADDEAKVVIIKALNSTFKIMNILIKYIMEAWIVYSFCWQCHTDSPSTTSPLETTVQSDRTSIPHTPISDALINTEYFS